MIIDSRKNDKKTGQLDAAKIICLTNNVLLTRDTRDFTIN